MRRVFNFGDNGNDSGEIQEDLDSQMKDKSPSDIAKEWGKAIDARTEAEELRLKVKELEGKLEEQQSQPTARPTISGSGADRSASFLAMLKAIAGTFGTGRVIMLCAGIIAAVIGLSGIFSLTGTVAGWFQPKITYSLSAVINATQACGELTTYRAYFEAVAEHKEDSKIPGMSRKILIIFGGTIDCGLDMRRANIEIFSEDKKITITLPHCEIQRVHIEHEEHESGDKQAVRIYDEQVGTFASHFSAEEQSKILGQHVTRIRHKTETNSNILLQAEKSARDLFTNFLSPLGYKTTVEFTDDPDRLKPSKDGERIPMKSGGVIIVHSEADKKTKEEE